MTVSMHDSRVHNCARKTVRTKPRHMRAPTRYNAQRQFDDVAVLLYLAVTPPISLLVGVLDYCLCCLT